MQNDLILADLHFTSKKEDEYRFGIFSIIDSVIEEQKISRLIFLGDLTERKDRHTSALVNKIITYFKKLTNNTNLDSIIFLCGNHDFFDIKHPFFSFVKHFNKITFIQEPTVIGSDLFVPSTVKADEFDFKKYSNKIRRIFLHHTVENAVWNLSSFITSKEGFIPLRSEEHTSELQSH